jgi:hypothetical protein
MNWSKPSDHLDTYNGQPKPYDWTRTATEIFSKVARAKCYRFHAHRLPNRKVKGEKDSPVAWPILRETTPPREWGRARGRSVGNAE